MEDGHELETVLENYTNYHGTLGIIQFSTIAMLFGKFGSFALCILSVCTIPDREVAADSVL